MIKDIILGKLLVAETGSKTDNYTELKEIVLTQSADQANFYPTPQEVYRLFKDSQVRGAFTTYDHGERIFHGYRLLDALPLKTEKAKQLGYEQFLQIVKRKEVKNKATRGKAIPTVIFGAEPKEERVAGGFLEGSHPFIEIGGPHERSSFTFSPQPVIQVNHTPLIDVLGRISTEFIADPENLPFPEGSIGAVFTHREQPDIWDEVERVLEEGGVWISSGLKTLTYENKGGNLHRRPPLGYVRTS